jgi:hypothetical protein
VEFSFFGIRHGEVLEETNCQAFNWTNGQLNTNGNAAVESRRRTCGMQMDRKARVSRLKDKRQPALTGARCRPRAAWSGPVPSLPVPPGPALSVVAICSCLPASSRCGEPPTLRGPFNWPIWPVEHCVCGEGQRLRPAIPIGAGRIAMLRVPQAGVTFRLKVWPEQECQKRPLYG